MNRARAYKLYEECSRQNEVRGARKVGCGHGACVCLTVRIRHGCCFLLYTTEPIRATRKRVVKGHDGLASPSEDEGPAQCES